MGLFDDLFGSDKKKSQQAFGLFSFMNEQQNDNNSEYTDEELQNLLSIMIKPKIAFGYISGTSDSILLTGKDLSSTFIGAIVGSRNDCGQHLSADYQGNGNRFER